MSGDAYITMLPLRNESTNSQSQVNMLVKLLSALSRLSSIIPFLNFGLEDNESAGLDIVELSSLLRKQDGLVPESAQADETGTDVRVGVGVRVDGAGGSGNKTEAQKIWESIDPEERKLVEGQDMLEKDKNGNPIYRVAMGSDGKYHIYKSQGLSGYSYKCVKEVKMGSNYLHTSSSGKKWNPETKEYEDVPNYKVMHGLENGDGSDVDVDVKVEVDNDENAPDSQNGKDGQDVKVKVKVEVGSQGGGGFYLDEGGNTMSPLVVDFNGDGKVDAQAGIGVDIDGDGKVDGAAINGDKMLAMSDINGNGTIDGAEVFGNKTVDPFTGEPINAENGFEALKQVALSAEKETGIKCFDGKNVDLNKLKQCLALKGIKLGFVSDENNTEVEDLSKVDRVNVQDYIETPESGDVQHNQQGSGTDENGNEIKIDDVWFRILNVA